MKFGIGKDLQFMWICFDSYVLCPNIFKIKEMKIKHILAHQFSLLLKLAKLIYETWNLYYQCVSAQSFRHV